MTDVERWPEWTQSVTHAERLSPPPFKVGSRARIKQPRLKDAVWTVTALEPLAGFTWEAGRPGLTSIASHRIEQRAAGTTDRHARAPSTRRAGAGGVVAQQRR